MLEGLEPPAKSYFCKVGTLLVSLDAADAQILSNALADESTWPAWTLSQALKAKGAPLGDGPIRNHRRGSCRCKAVNA
jgi:hypothetical protein